MKDSFLSRNFIFPATPVLRSKLAEKKEQTSAFVTVTFRNIINNNYNCRSLRVQIDMVARANTERRSNPIKKRRAN